MKRSPYDELCIAAEARGLRVLLHAETRARLPRESLPFVEKLAESPTWLSRLAVVDRDRDEVAALPLRDDRTLDEAAAVLLEYLGTASGRPA